MKWPGPLKALTRALRRAKKGDIIEVISNERKIEAASRAWCRRTGSKTLRVELEPDGIYVVAIEVKDGRKHLGIPSPRRV